MVGHLCSDNIATISTDPDPHAQIKPDHVDKGFNIPGWQKNDLSTRMPGPHRRMPSQLLLLTLALRVTQLAPFPL